MVLSQLQAVQEHADVEVSTTANSASAAESTAPHTPLVSTPPAAASSQSRRRLADMTASSGGREGDRGDGGGGWSLSSIVAGSGGGGRVTTTAANACAGSECEGRRHSKGSGGGQGVDDGLDKDKLLARVRAGRIVGFASREYDAGHRCDHVRTFLATSSAYEVQYEFGCEPYTVLPRVMAHEYEERFVGYGKDRVSWNYELAAKGVRFVVPADSFLVHFNTYDEGKRKSKYGHFPTDWMLGESCWPAFRDRVQAQYNFSLYTCHQTMVDGLHRGKFEVCASEAEKICVLPYCTPRISVITHRGNQMTTVRYPQTHPLPYPASAAGSKDGVELAYPGPRLVLLGCEGCGIPELWRTLLAARLPRHRLQVAMTNPGEPAWRDRQVRGNPKALTPRPKCLGP